MDKFCSDIHNNLSITLSNKGVSLGPCCWYKDSPIMVDKIWDHKKLIEIRKENKDNILSLTGCSQCIYMENNGGISRRTGVNQYYNSRVTDLTGPRGLEISIDYTCNLACIYCQPSLSTQWRLELGTDKNKFPVRLSELDITKLLDKIDLTNLDNIHFYGGDPLFTNTHEFILNYIDKRVGLRSIYVWYNTNGTLRVKPRVFDLWNKCRLIKLYFSIDDIGPRFEYLRYGAVWQEVEDNILWYKEHSPVNVMFAIQPTINCLNLYYHQELIKWKQQNIDANRLGDFTDLTRHNVFRKFQISSIPDELMRKCVENNKIDGWVSEFSSSFKFNPQHQKNTIAEIKILDQRRNLNFTSVFPELASYFG